MEKEVQDNDIESVIERQTPFGITRSNRNGYGSRIAEFSSDFKYRWELIIRWKDRGPMLNFLMLNPSTADEMENDPTVERCEQRGRMWGFSGIIVTNLFGFRSTDPSGLYSEPEPVGEFNDNFIGHAYVCCAATVCAWGQHGKHLQRAYNVKKLLMEIGECQKLYYLKLAKDGSPCHPLYLSYDLEMKEWW